MEQRLRLVQTSAGRPEKRGAERRRLKLPGQLVWKDGRGRTHFAPVETLDVSDQGVRIETRGVARIAQYRLVYFQLERHLRSRTDIPPALRQQNVLCAVFRVGPSSDVTGTPADYGLRFIIEPGAAASRPEAWTETARADTRSA